mmetsp:Transcript_26112/g.31609  ORF Transcript_26112/g.31609 Transcript_26112/m.31609 type:complete len:90 (-) Transcript_26112:521-790(-)
MCHYNTLSPAGSRDVFDDVTVEKEIRLFCIVVSFVSFWYDTRADTVFCVSQGVISANDDVINDIRYSVLEQHVIPNKRKSNQLYATESL